MHEPKRFTTQKSSQSDPEHLWKLCSKNEMFIQKSVTANTPRKHPGWMASSLQHTTTMNIS